eukprot:1266575-Amphidinium_carterae.1
MAMAVAAKIGDKPSRLATRSTACQLMSPWLLQPRVDVAMAFSAKSGARLSKMICSILKLIVAMKEHTSLLQALQ